MKHGFEESLQLLILGSKEQLLRIAFDRGGGGQLLTVGCAGPGKGDFVTDCVEGNLEWVTKERVPDLPIWEGDKIFLRLLAENAPPFLLTLEYTKDELIRAVLNGERII